MLRSTVVVARMWGISVVDLYVLWVVGVVAMVPVAVWWARDLARIPGRTWYWTGHHRRPWQWAVLLGWLAGGWPAMIVVLVWARSPARAQLLSEVEHGHRPASGASHWA